MATTALDPSRMESESIVQYPTKNIDRQVRTARLVACRWVTCRREPVRSEMRHLPRSTRDPQASGNSSVRLRVNRAYPGKALFAVCARFSGAGNGIYIPKPKSLDLTFDLLPLMAQPREDNTVTALKVRTQLAVAQGLSIDVFHRRAEMLPTRGRCSKPSTATTCVVREGISWQQRLRAPALRGLEAPH
jgi:hypothetical protein